MTTQVVDTVAAYAAQGADLAALVDAWIALMGLGLALAAVNAPGWVRARVDAGPAPKVDDRVVVWPDPRLEGRPDDPEWWRFRNQALSELAREMPDVYGPEADT